MLLEENGKIIAHGNSAAKTEKSCMLGGICVDHAYRGNGYAQKVLSVLSEYIHQELKRCLAFLHQQIQNTQFSKRLDLRFMGHGRL